jgi:hypothetical protein
VSKGKAQALQSAMDDELDAYMESDNFDPDEYARMMAAYNGFEEGSSTHETKTRVASSGFSASVTTVLDWKSIRAANYPSSFDAGAITARDAYVNANKNPANSNEFKCPGAGTSAKPAHWARTSDVSIDHIVPVATHWNSTGYNTSRAVRNTWYNDTKNHAYVCVSCNSSMGSGGVLYTKPPGPSYSS